MFEIYKLVTKKKVSHFKLTIEIIEIVLFFIILFVSFLFELLFQNKFNLIFLILVGVTFFIPILLITRNIMYFNSVFNFISNRPLAASSFSFCLLLIMPLAISMSLLKGDNRFEIVINGLLSYTSFSIIFIGFIDSIIFQIRIIKKSITDIILEKRPTEKKDILVIVSTYLNFILIFTLIYFLLQSFSDGIAFKSILVASSLSINTLYLSLIDCFYYSVITISTLGYGDIYPISWYSKLAVTTEVFLGLLLLTFSLGIILSGRKK